MKPVIMFLGIITVLCTLASRQIDRYFGKQDRPALVATASAATPPAYGGSRSVTLQGDNRGHFQVDARVDGRSLDFLVDTGASTVVLRESAASRLGIFPTPRDYTVKTQTANGIGKAARVQLSRIELNGITVRDIEAFVVPDQQLAVNLLGMSFLSRVKFTHDRGRLIIEQ